MSTTSKYSKKNALALIFTGAALAVTSATIPVNASSAPSEIQGETPPAGYRLVTYNEALHHTKQLCSILHQWDIARLANGASMDGPGYGCKVRPDDSRTLGNAIVIHR